METLFWVCLKASFSSVFFPEDVLSLFSQVLMLVDEDWLLDLLGLLEFVNASSCLCTAPGRRRRRHRETERDREIGIAI